jgi:hypothetical protein
MPAAGRLQRSLGDRLPDQFGDIDDQIRPALIWVARRADLADADADGIIQPAIRL